MNPPLSALRRCFEGAVPATVSTCDLDGTPNVALLSQVHYVDEQHVALSYQFFNTTRKNILVNPRATLQLVDPISAAHYHLHLEYLHTETQGPLFEHMKAKLAGIASHSGMSKIFRLLGSDVYRVLRIEQNWPEAETQLYTESSATLAALRHCLHALMQCSDLAGVFDTALLCLQQKFNMAHSMLLMLDADGKRLYTVASAGYETSGVGSEIALGEGIIGVAARERTTIRIGYMAQEYLYSSAVRQSFLQSAAAIDLETEIPLPGLPESRSQLAVPIKHAERLLGVLYVESPENMRFSAEEEDALAALSDFLALAIQTHAQSTELCPDAGLSSVPVPPVQGAALQIKKLPLDHSIFIDNDYLIKGVAGSIFWKLLRDYMDCGRTEFTNRELRHDASLCLPDLTDNLEARLILLQRRLSERSPHILLEKTGRGRFRLVVKRPLRLLVA